MLEFGLEMLHNYTHLCTYVGTNTNFVVLKIILILFFVHFDSLRSSLVNIKQDNRYMTQDMFFHLAALSFIT